MRRLTRSRTHPAPPNYHGPTMVQDQLNDRPTSIVESITYYNNWEWRLRRFQSRPSPTPSRIKPSCTDLLFEQYTTTATVKEAPASMFCTHRIWLVYYDPLKLGSRKLPTLPSSAVFTRFQAPTYSSIYVCHCPVL